MIWNNEDIEKLRGIIKIDLNDKDLRDSLSEYHFNSIAGGVREVANYLKESAIEIIEKSDRTDDQKKADKEGIERYFDKQNKNPDYMDLGSYLYGEEIKSIYNSSFAMMLSTNILSSEVKEAFPSMLDDLKEAKNSQEFLKSTSLAIADKIGCSTLAHQLLYDGKANGSRPFFPIVNLRTNGLYHSEKNSTNRYYYDAKDRLKEYYSEFNYNLQKSGLKLSREAASTIFAYAVLDEVDKIEKSPNFKEYKDKNVYMSEVTWGQTLEEFKKYINTEYLPKNCFLMTENLFTMKTEMDKYDKAVHLVNQGKTVNANRNMSHDIGENALCHIHHIFPASQFPEFADQQVNYAPLVPSDHLGVAHPDNNTKEYNKEFQQFLLFQKFEECSKDDIKTCKLIKKDGERLGFLNMLDKAYKTNEFTDAYSRNPEMTKYEFADLLAKYDKDFTRPLQNEYIRKTVFVDWYKEHNTNDNPKFSKSTYNEILDTFASKWRENLTTDFITKSVGFTDNKLEKQLAVNDLIKELRDNNGRPDEYDLIKVLKDNMKKDYASYKEQGLSQQEIKHRIVESSELLIGVDHGFNRYLAVPVHETLKAITKQAELDRYYEYHKETMKYDYDAKLKEAGSNFSLDKALKLYEIEPSFLSTSEKQIREEYLDECNKLAKLCNYGKTPYQVIDENFDKNFQKFIDRYEEKDRENYTNEHEEVRILDGECR